MVFFHGILNRQISKSKQICFVETQNSTKLLAGFLQSKLQATGASYLRIFQKTHFVSLLRWFPEKQKTQKCDINYTCS